MSGINNLKTRLRWEGGDRQIERMNEDKLRTLKRALIYSYQSATAVLADGREFRCLINSDMIKNEYDNKLISIPFADVCLNEVTFPKEIRNTFKKNSEGLQEIGMKTGDVFTWKENGTDWIVYLQKLEETAYFRAELRRCKHEVEIEGKMYKAYAGNHSLDMMDWRRQHNIEFNELDYTLVMYITKDEHTVNYLKRFALITIDDKPWQVQAADAVSSDGIVMVFLKEYYSNTIADAIEEENKQKELENEIPPIENPDDEDIEPKLEGPTSVYPYEIHKYKILNAEGGEWRISNGKAEIYNKTDTQVEIGIISGKSGTFDLVYVRKNKDMIKFTIQILSL